MNDFVWNIFKALVNALRAHRASERRLREECNAHFEEIGARMRGLR